MPGISGLELSTEAHRQFPRTAFLMATGVGDVSVGVAAMKQGAADYILKPFQMDAVVASLRRAVEMKRMETELDTYRHRLEEMVEQRTNQLKAAMNRIEFTYDETLEALAAALDCTTTKPPATRAGSRFTRWKSRAGWASRMTI